MSLYQQRRIGVLKTDTGQVVVPQSGELWAEYQTWLAEGNVPDPYKPPILPPETVEEAKSRRWAEIRAEGMASISIRFPAVKTFDSLLLVQELVRSIVPSAQQLTPDIIWLCAMWSAAEAAQARIKAANTIPAVNAVTVVWPT